MNIQSLHQIEITSRCNLACRYCAHPKMPRAKQDMDEATFIQALTWVQRFARAGTQHELNLAGIGESTLHPDFPRWVGLAREALGWDGLLALATNGLLLTDELCAEIAPYRPAVWVSLHRPEKAGPAVEAARKHGILHGTSTDPSTAAINWAGQVDWHVSSPPGRVCQWMGRGLAFVYSDGDVGRCCLDGTGEGVYGTVWDAVPGMKVSPYGLCRTCDQALPPGMEPPPRVFERDLVDGVNVTSALG